MKAPNGHRLADLVKSAEQNQANINGRWVPARPLAFASVKRRLSLAWHVFTGKADAVYWPEGQ